MTQKPNTQRYSPMKATTLAAIIFSLVFMAASIHAQTWFTVAHDGDSISIPAGTGTRYGAKKGTLNGCNPLGPVLATDAWATPTKLGATVSSADLGIASDPAWCYVKELDVAETASVQIVQVNGRLVTVPALPVVVVVPPPVPPPPATQTLTCSVTLPNFPVTYTPGAPASTLSAAITSSFNAIVSGMVVSCK